MFPCRCNQFPGASPAGTDDLAAHTASTTEATRPGRLWDHVGLNVTPKRGQLRSQWNGARTKRSVSCSTRAKGASFCKAQWPSTPRSESQTEGAAAP